MDGACNKMPKAVVGSHVDERRFLACGCAFFRAPSQWGGHCPGVTLWVNAQRLTAVKPLQNHVRAASEQWCPGCDPLYAVRHTPYTVRSLDLHRTSAVSQAPATFVERSQARRG